MFSKSYAKSASNRLKRANYGGVAVVVRVVDQIGHNIYYLNMDEAVYSDFYKEYLKQVQMTVFELPRHFNDFYK